LPCRLPGYCRRVRCRARARALHLFHTARRTPYCCRAHYRRHTALPALTSPVHRLPAPHDAFACRFRTRTAFSHFSHRAAPARTLPAAHCRTAAPRAALPAALPPAHLPLLRCCTPPLRTPACTLLHPGAHHAVLYRFTRFTTCLPHLATRSPTTHLPPAVLGSFSAAVLPLLPHAHHLITARTSLLHSTYLFVRTRSPYCYVSMYATRGVLTTFCTGCIAVLRAPRQQT